MGEDFVFDVIGEVLVIPCFVKPGEEVGAVAVVSDDEIEFDVVFEFVA